MRDAFETTAVGWQTIIIGWVLTAFALLSVTIYIWLKIVMNAPFHHLEDIFLYLSFLLSLALMSLTTWAVVVEGQGQHQSAESRSQFDLVAKSLLVNELLWGIVNTLLRIDAILFIRRVFSPIRSWNIVTIILLVASVAYAVAAIATSLAICQPLSAGWDRTVMGSCGNEVVAYLCLETISAVLDLAIVIAPLPPVMRLQLSRSRKWSICILLSLGSAVLIITGLRIAALNRVNSNDFSYDRGYIGLLSILGPLIAIICCCTTACAGPVYRRFRLWAQPSGFSSSKIVWRLSTCRGRWWPSTATRKNQETDFGEVMSKPEPLKSVSTLELLKTNSTGTAMSTPTLL